MMAWDNRGTKRVRGRCKTFLWGGINRTCAPGERSMSDHFPLPPNPGLRLSVLWMAALTRRSVWDPLRWRCLWDIQVAVTGKLGFQSWTLSERSHRSEGTRQGEGVRWGPTAPWEIPAFIDVGWRRGWQRDKKRGGESRRNRKPGEAKLWGS